MPKIIYMTVCKNTILSNRKNKRNDPPIRISEGKYGKPWRTHSYLIPDACRVKVVYSPDKPLPWGARAWVEVEIQTEEEADQARFMIGDPRGASR